MIYLDNAATSFPKAPGVADAVRDFLSDAAGNANRASHEGSIAASRLLFDVREAAAQLLGVADSRRVIFTPGATWSINTILQGLLKSGDRVLVSAAEHNAVMRPLSRLARERGVVVERFAVNETGVAELTDYQGKLANRPALVMVTAVGNVTGAAQPWSEMADLAHAAGTLFALDAAQACGSMPIDANRVDFLAVSGHKGLLGPTGIGLLYAREGIDLRPLIFGGTGSRSTDEEQPTRWPDAMESGTLNLAGIAGLGVALAWLARTGVANIEESVTKLARRARERLSGISGIRLHGPEISHGIVSFTHEGAEVSDIVMKLDRAGIAVRGGLHCAPGAHRALGTFPEGTVRLSFGPFNREADIEAVHEVLTR